MTTLQPEKSAPDLEEERASTPLSLTCKEDYANATDCLSEGRTTGVDAAVEADSLVSEMPVAVTSSSGKAFASGSQQCDIADLPGSLKDYYTDDKSVSQPTVKMEKEDDDSDSFANFVAQELHEHEHEDDNTTSLSSTSPAISPIMPTMSNSQNENGLITSLITLGDAADIAALKIPVEDCIPTPVDMTARNFPKRSKYAHRAAISAMHPYNRTRGGGVSIVKTLELLKAVLQTSFNQEVKQLCDSYLDIYKLAANNIYDNTREVVPKETLRTLVCKMLDEAGQCFHTSRYELANGRLPRNDKVTELSGSPMSARKHKMDRDASHKRPIKKPKRNVEKYERAIPRAILEKRKAVDPNKWHPEQINLETLFVLGVNANKALGHGASRGKIYYAHPELFKYPADGNDKTWLYDNKHLPVHGGKAFLMFLDELKSMVESNEGYKDNENVHVHEMEGFKLPPFLLAKVQHYIRSLQKHHTERNFEKAQKPSTSKTFEDLDESLEEAEAI